MIRTAAGRFRRLLPHRDDYTEAAAIVAPRHPRRRDRRRGGAAVGVGVRDQFRRGSRRTAWSPAVVAGLVAAVFGGSHVQVSGPTGAMAVVLAPIVAQHGLGSIAHW